jgi:hypothetical protein
LKTLEKTLADDRTYAEKDRYFDLIREYESLKKTIESNYARWEELQKRLTSNQ